MVRERNKVRATTSLAMLALGLTTLSGIDTRAADDVPKGEVQKFIFDQSRVFPGTVRDVWVYVPKQYEPSKPACLYVNQDGIQYNAPAVFDQLIAAGEMPVTIGVFVMHGRVKAATDQALDRFNRSFEYDGLGPNYARFLIEELLPEVEKRTTEDGRPIRLSNNPNDRAIGGSSSGAICAWTVAWERPDSFRRVFSSIGTYVGLRGGNNYPTLIRKVEPKPIRVFLEDGSNDLNIYGGDWWMANQEMERSLVFAGYEVEHNWGDGGHNGKHATEVFPDAMQWLWKGWPGPVKAGQGSPQMREILVPDEEWQLVAEGHQFTEGPAATEAGEVYFTDIPASRSYRIDLDGKVTTAIENTRRGNGQAIAPDGRLIMVATETAQIVSYDREGKATVLAEGVKGNDVVARHDGLIYVTNPGAPGTETSKVWLIRPDGTTQVVDEGLKFSNGICLSPDQSLLHVADARSRWVYSYQIQADGTLAHKQKYHHLHVPDTADDAGADGMKTDRDGRLYVATRMGIQVCDQAGRVNAIIPTPNGRISNLAFGGKDHDVLYATCGDKVYRRKVQPRGALPQLGPIKPAAPRL
jgi:sugar lactone lactonase YvrE/enterochelin esterase-like enzyme